MKRLVWGLGGLLLAAGSQGALHRYLPEAAGFFDFFLILTVYYALGTNQVAGMFVGLVCGLVQDGAFAPNPIGRNGFAKALIGYVVGGLGRRVELAQPLPQLLVLLGATALQTLTFVALHLVLDLKADFSGRRLLLSMAANGLLGIVLYRAVRRRTGKGK